MPKPDLSSIKKRLSSKQEQPAADKEKEAEPRIRQETHKQVAKFSREMHKLAEQEVKSSQEGRVDLGPLPEGVKAEEEDTLFYRNTSFDNPEVRRAIEDKCSAMDFADLIMTGRVIQDVPILPNKLEVTMQSLLAAETFWIEKNASDYGNTDWTVRSWMGYARLTISLKEINGSVLPDHRNKAGDIDKASFDAKYARIMNLGEKLIELLFVNLNWFNDRVEKLYQDDFELLKNG
jgi:hypothetical protein